MSLPDSIQPPTPVNPRPGVVRSLGICNIVFSVLMTLCLGLSTIWFLVAMGQSPTTVPAKVTVNVGSGPATGRPMVSFNPFMGMNDPIFLKFTFIDVGTSTLLNGLMFITGVGLINLKRWSARWWVWIAWAKLLRLFFLWGFYILAVAPILSEKMGRSVLDMISAQGVPNAKLPPLSQLTQMYSIANLVLAVSVMVGGAIYPAITLLLIGRPGLQAALVGPPRTEPELP